jgi:hypothetical protein
MPFSDGTSRGQRLGQDRDAEVCRSPMRVKVENPALEEPIGMVEVLWVAIFGGALAWLQARSAVEEPAEIPLDARPPVDDEWRRWEEQIYDWRDQ